MTTLAIINQKGGVGKSTTALAIGAGLLLKGYKVLFVDLDAQGNLSYSLGADMQGHNVLSVLQGKAKAVNSVQTTPEGDILASTPGLAAADTLLIGTGKEYRLQEALEPLQSRYDYIIIDTPPALGVLTVNALTACTGAIIPAQADIFSLQGIGQLNSTIEAVKKYTNPALRIEGIVLTRFNARAIISREIAEMLEGLADQLHTRLYQTAIRECTALKEAQATQQSIFRYAPRSNASKDYKDLLTEIIEGSQNHDKENLHR